MKIKNETEIQLMKILFKTNKKKPTKNITSQRAYPHGVEAKYYRQLQGYFKPLTDYVTKYINENMDPLLRGDSEEIKLDAIPGNAFRDMLNNLENWLSVYMPDISEIPEPKNNNVIFLGLGKTADEAYSFVENDFEKIIEKGIHVKPPVTAEWWNDMKSSWAEDNYTLITSNAKNYVSKINTLTEQAIVNGLSSKKLSEEIMKATDNLSKAHCKLLARDQIGKLTGQINQAQMEELGLDLYVWSTAMDDRVRESHAAMEGLLCRWDNASVCSYDNGKTWVPRPGVMLHPGQDIQCRCMGLAYYPELIAEVENVGLDDLSSPALSSSEDVNTDIVVSPVPEISHFTVEQLQQLDNYIDEVLSVIENEEVRKYAKDSLNDISVSNLDSKILFYKTSKKMRKPYIVLSDETIYSKKIINLNRVDGLKNPRNIIHELGHAFAELTDIRGLNYSLDKKFISALNKDYTNLLNRYKTEEALNKHIISVVKRNKRSYAGISDIIGAKQKNPLPGLPGHDKKYWVENENRIYKESFADIFQMMFDKKGSVLVQQLFPESYNIIKKRVVYGVKGEL